MLAAINGITEIVKVIIEENPQAVEYVDKEEHNIFHAVFQNRHLKIYKYLKDTVKTPTRRLGWRRDKERNTILHHVAVTDYCREDDKPNPALHLQDELRWYKVRHFLYIVSLC